MGRRLCGLGLGSCWACGAGEIYHCAARSSQVGFALLIGIRLLSLVPFSILFRGRAWGGCRLRERSRSRFAKSGGCKNRNSDKGVLQLGFEAQVVYPAKLLGSVGDERAAGLGDAAEGVVGGEAFAAQEGR